MVNRRERDAAKFLRTVLPEEMRDAHRWGVWRSVLQPGGKKPRKIPEPSVNQPELWTSFERATEKLERSPHHAGLAFYLGDEWAGVDLDRVRDPVSRTLTPLAKEFIATLDTYAEVSPSGTGVKLYMRGRLPDGAGNKIVLDDGTSIEFYDHGRFFAVTGERLQRSRFAKEDRSREIAAVYRLAQKHAKSPVAATIGQRRTGAEWAALLGGYGPGNHDNLTVSVMGKLAAHGIEPELIEALLIPFDHWSECVLGRRAFGEKEIRRKRESVERMQSKRVILGSEFRWVSDKGALWR